MYFIETIHGVLVDVQPTLQQARESVKKTTPPIAPVATTPKVIFTLTSNGKKEYVK